MRQVKQNGALQPNCRRTVPADPIISPELSPPASTVSLHGNREAGREGKSSTSPVISMRLFQLDPLGVLAILAMLLVLAVPFEKPGATASHAAETSPMTQAKTHDTAADTTTAAKVRK